MIDYLDPNWRFVITVGEYPTALGVAFLAGWLCRGEES